MRRARLAVRLFVIVLVCTAVAGLLRPPEAGAEPTVSMTSAPEPTTSSASATFTWTLGADVAYARCSLDAGYTTYCSSPHTYTLLEPGPHTFTVRAIGWYGGAATATHTWTITAGAPAAGPVPPPPPVPTPSVPTVSVTTGPPSSTTSTTATIDFAVTGSAETTTCSLDGNAEMPCSAPAEYAGLASGTHSFRVTVANAAGSASATHTWTVLSTSFEDLLPTVTVTSAPESATAATSAVFTWNTTGYAWSASCSLDGGYASYCTSPWSYSGLQPGTHTFRVTVSNSYGSASADYTWTVTAPAGAPPTPAPGGACTPGSDWGTLRSELAARVAELINAHRAALGLRTLETSAALTASAVWKAQHMARYDYMSHEDPAPPIARTAGERMRDCGLSQYAGWGENIAWGYPSAEAVVQGWLASPGHRANIENGSFAATGVGAATSASGRLYWAQTFATG